MMVEVVIIILVLYYMICNQASVENSWDFSQVEKKTI